MLLRALRETPILYYAFLCCALIPWAIMESAHVMNVDIAYLSKAATYILSGEPLRLANYDPNPPLSFIIYFPPALLYKYLGVPLDIGYFIYTLGLLGGSTWLTASLLKYMPDFTKVEKHVLLGTFILANSVATQMDFGQRENILAMYLLPFLLAQICITKGTPIPRPTKHIALACGAFFMMLKPFFYIVPATLIVHRLYRSVNILSLFRLDTIYLASFAFLYVLTLLVFFDDYLFEILPDALAFYVTPESNLMQKYAPITALICFCLFLVCFLLDEQKTRHSLFFAVLFTLSLIPFFIQNKGYYYHLLPAIMFLYCALGFMAVDILKNIFKLKNSALVPYAILIVITAALYSLYIPNQQITKKDFQDSAFYKLVSECEEPECSFFFFNDSHEFFPQISVYTDQRHASRFSTLWWLPGVLKLNNPESFQKYARLVAQDIERFAPKILIIGRFTFNRDPQTFNLIDFLSHHNPTFSETMENYHHQKTITVSRNEIMPNVIFARDTAKYDIFYLNPPPQSPEDEKQ